MITKGERRNRGESGNRTPSTYRARTRTVGYRKVQDRYSKARKGANQWRFYQKTTLTLTGQQEKKGPGTILCKHHQSAVIPMASYRPRA